MIEKLTKKKPTEMNKTNEKNLRQARCYMYAQDNRKRPERNKVNFNFDGKKISKKNSL